MSGCEDCSMPRPLGRKDQRLTQEVWVRGDYFNKVWPRAVSLGPICCHLVPLWLVRLCACPGHAFILHASSLQSSPALIMHRDMVGMQKLLVQPDALSGGRVPGGHLSGSPRQCLSLLHDAPSWGLPSLGVTSSGSGKSLPTQDFSYNFEQPQP